LASLVADLLIGLFSYEVALVVFSWLHGFDVKLFADVFYWGIPVGLAAVVITFLVLGLYKMEVYVSRTLHVITLCKAALVALLVVSSLAFAFKAALVTHSRLTILTAFGVFVIVDALVRVLALDHLYRSDVRDRKGGSVVIGASADSLVITSRCGELRGFAPVRVLEPLDKRRNGFDAEPELLEALETATPAPRQVFLDGASVGHKATFDLVAAARRRGSEVYITGRLASSLDTTKLLIRLFEMPVMRVRREPHAGDRVPPSKRAFDVATAAAALVVLSPLLAVIAVLVRWDSPGPALYRQTRVGLRGRTFELLKFRSMSVGNDASQHQAVTRRFIDGCADDAVTCADRYGRLVLKLANDERVTRIGRYLRKYSLDELPQFWNVLTGDLSMVGPRPGLEFEVESYKAWHRRRLEVAPGVSGLWQISGRARVGFDEMVFQDIMYGYNQSLLTDVSICLRTVPALLSGRGAA